MKLEETLSTYSGPILEKLYHEIYRNSGNYTEVGNYWEKGNRNEIDLVFINELDKTIKIGEIKLNKEKIHLNRLKEKSLKLVKAYTEYYFEYLSLGLQDVERVLREEKEL